MNVGVFDKGKIMANKIRTEVITGLDELNELYELGKTRDFSKLRELVQLAVLLEKKLYEGPIAILPYIGFGVDKYKVVKFPLNEWLLAGGVISKDHPTILEALKNDGI
jgi:hypothetical protein